MGLHSIQFSICSGIIFFATFVPKGSFSLNPKAIEGIRNEQEFDDESSIDDSVRREKDDPIAGA